MEEISPWFSRKRSVVTRVDYDFNKVVRDIQEKQRRGGSRVMTYTEITRRLIDQFNPNMLTKRSNVKKK